MTNKPKPFIRSITKSKYDHIAIFVMTIACCLHFISRTIFPFCINNQFVVP